MKKFFISLLLLINFAHAGPMAITVMFTGDEEFQEWANQVNKEIFATNPKGFRFDDSHLSHVTIFQSYVEVSCLDEKWDDIEKEIRGSKLLKEKLTSKELKIEALPAPSILSLLNANLSGSGKILLLQKKVEDVLKPCKSESETPKAFYGQMSADDFIISYVKNFSSQSSGDHYKPHMTLGVGKSADLEKILAKNTVPKEITIKRIGVFRMGAYGSARERLYSFE